MNPTLPSITCAGRSNAAITALTGVLLAATFLLANSVSAASPEESEPAVMMKKRMTASTDIRDVQACNESGVALSGIDVVSYHQATGPLMGNAEFTALHEGLTYRFLSDANRQAFVESPAKYLPSYLGWCATSLADGALTCPNPLNYKLENGTLLLFETTGFTNGQNLWNSDPLDFRRRADNNRDTFLAAKPNRNPS